MLRFCTLLLVLIGITTVAIGQVGTQYNNGSASVALGGIKAIGDDVGLFNNFSSIAGDHKISAAVSVQQRFELSDLNSGNLAVKYPLDEKQSLGLKLSIYGPTEFQAQRISFLYGRQLSKSYTIHIELGNNRISTEDYGSTNALVYTIGMSGTIIQDRLDYGLLVHNFQSFEISTTTDTPAEIDLGFGYRLNEKASLYFEIQKVVSEEIRFNMGIQYSWNDLKLRMGSHSAPGGFAFGLSYRFGSLSVAGSADYSSILGVSPITDIQYSRIRK